MSPLAAPAAVSDGHPSLGVLGGDPGRLESPVPILRALGGLCRVVELYPSGHSVVGRAVSELHGLVSRELVGHGALRLDISGGAAHVNGYAFRVESQANAPVLRLLPSLGVDSVHFREGVRPEEMEAVARLLLELQHGPHDDSLRSELDARGVRNISLGKLVPLDTRWWSHDWPDAPGEILDADYADSLQRAEDAFGTLSEGSADVVAIRDLLRLLTAKVASSGAALSQILAVKQYENHTYCHSVNVAVLSLLLARRVGLEAEATAALAEAALLHDVGKLRIPVDVLRKPGPLDRRERALIERHPKFGAELLVQVPDLSPITPTVALEHHRNVDGGGYPDLGSAEPIHPLSQLVAIVDTYEALTGARSYREPALPESACLILVQMADRKLNRALVKAFVSTISFFPVGSVVRTDREELAVVVETDPDHPLHPVLSLAREEDGSPEGGLLDTRARDASGAYVRNVVETLRPPAGFDLAAHFPADPSGAART